MSGQQVCSCGVWYLIPPRSRYLQAKCSETHLEAGNFSISFTSKTLNIIHQQLFRHVQYQMLHYLNTCYTEMVKVFLWCHLSELYRTKIFYCKYIKHIQVHILIHTDKDSSVLVDSRIKKFDNLKEITKGSFACYMATQYQPCVDKRVEDQFQDLLEILRHNCE